MGRNYTKKILSAHARFKKRARCHRPHDKMERARFYLHFLARFA
jgi:hypothetical protein